MKKVLGRCGNESCHWVGNGFPVRSLFSYNNLGPHISPFLLLDYAGPHVFTPTAERRGVGQHPHRGFETVTVVYEGEVEHRDSTGRGGVIGPGDVQWMTAGAGILHDEFHTEAFARSGGPLKMVQLWVNLPAKDKMTRPTYQSILAQDIPTADLAGAAGSARIIAGRMGEVVGPARTFTPVNVWDVRLRRKAEARLVLPEGHTAIVVALSGDVTVDGQRADAAEILLLSQAGDSVVLRSGAASMLLILTGEPISEPIVGRGPFVMNNQAELRQAFDDFDRGRFGEIPAA